MRSTVRVRIDSALLFDMDRYAGRFGGRYGLVEEAVRRFLWHLDRTEADDRDREIMDARADALNAEAEDVLGYQAWP